MLLKLAEYHWAERIDDALLLLARLDTKTVPLAGGTYLLGLHDESIQAVVDLRDLDLAYVSEDGQGMHIGAMTTLQQMADAPALQALARGLLARAAEVSSSSRLLRNCATIGGTLGAGSASQADVLTALAAMDAWATVRSSSRTQVNLTGASERSSGIVFKGKQERRLSCSSLHTDKRPNELIIEVVVPRPALSCGTSLERIARTANDVALLNCVALVEVEDGLYRKVRLAFGGLNMEPLRMHNLEKQLEGQPVLNIRDRENVQSFVALLRKGMSEFVPASDVLATNSYRRVTGASMAYRALEAATSVSHGHSVVSPSEQQASAMKGER